MSKKVMASVNRLADIIDYGHLAKVSGTDVFLDCVTESLEKVLAIAARHGCQRPTWAETLKALDEKLTSCETTNYSVEVNQALLNAQHPCARRDGGRIGMNKCCKCGKSGKTVHYWSYFGLYLCDKCGNAMADEEQAKNELIARAMGEERNCCPRCGGEGYECNSPVTRHCTRCHGLYELSEAIYPDYLNDANHAVRAWEWLILKVSKAYAMAIYLDWDIALERNSWCVSIDDHDGDLVQDLAADSFCAAICAAFAWWLEREEGTK